MPRMIDVERFCADNPNFNSEVYVALSKAPTVDAVPVVRCKDCKYWEIKNIVGIPYGMCALLIVDMKMKDYCSYGERRCDNDTP